MQEQQSRHLQWDASDQLRQFATWTGAGSAPTLLAYYVYDAGGQRTKKLTQTGPGTWQVTVYVDGSFEHRYEVRNGVPSDEQTVVSVLDGQSRLYQRRSGAALGDQRPAELYTLEDHLGSASATVDATGALVSREEYYPFGETSFGSHEKQRYRFCGKERDQESGLYYYGMRYYAPWLCRFVSVDPLAAKYTYYTPYQYAGNQPINFIDLDGGEPAPPKTDSNPASTSPTQESTVNKVLEFVQANSLSGLLDGLSISLENMKPAYNSNDRFREPNLVGDGQPGEGKALVRALINTVQGTADVVAHPVEATKVIGRTVKKSYTYLANSTAEKVGKDALDMLKSTNRTNDGKQLEREEEALTSGIAASSALAELYPKLFFNPDVTPLSYGKNAVGHLIKHRDALGFGYTTVNQAQKMIPRLKAALADLFEKANPVYTRVGNWNQIPNARMYISNGRMIVLDAKGEFVTVINREWNNWYRNAKPINGAAK